MRLVLTLSTWVRRWDQLIANASLSQHASPHLDKRCSRWWCLKVSVYICFLTSLTYHTNYFILLFLSSTGKNNGTIARHELPTLPIDLHYRCQEKAWFDEEVMLDWVECCLKPYTANVPCGILPLLLLDDFKVHKMGVVIQAIQALGMEVEFIPPGCTGMVQPVNVGYNKPLKAKVHDQYHEWIFVQDLDMLIPCPTRHHVSEWIIMAECMIEDTMVSNAWRKTGFSFLPNKARV
jgi:hypothetical protein